MTQDFKAPYLPYPEIVKAADNFISHYHPARTTPVPIDDIVEFRLRLGIDPRSNFKNYTGIESAISNDLKTIYIDSYLISANFENRYRYSLAHEVGHIILHADVFRSFPCKNAYDWKRFIMEIDPIEYNWLETHAYQFAGLILVPPTELALELKTIKSSFERGGKIPTSENVIFEEYALNRLKEKFKVSSAVIERRLNKDGISIFR